MHNNSKTLSATDINKYTYCHYQFYYERKYGTKHLNELKKNRLKELNIESTNTQNELFKKGNDFHLDFEKNRSVGITFIKFFIFIFVIMLIIFIFYFWGLNL